jgi:hypothetical protein
MGIAGGIGAAPRHCTMSERFHAASVESSCAGRPPLLPPPWVESGCSRCGRATAAWGRRLPLAVPMNERLLFAVGHPKPAVPVSASTSHSVACLNVREGSRPAVRGKRPGYRCFGWKADLWFFVTPTKRRAVCSQPDFRVTAAQAILKNLGWRFCSMAKLVFGLSQSLDGYVDHLEMQPGPALFRHFYEKCATSPAVSTVAACTR